MARLRDVAMQAGVSTATVSNVLRGTKATSPEVRERVLRAALELGYVPNPHAQSLRTGQSRTIGLVVPDLTNPYFPALAQAIEATARAHGYALLVMDAGNDPGRDVASLALMASYRVAGVVWVPVADEAKPAGPFPIVTVDRPVPGCDAVVADHALGGALIARHARALGHTRVGMLSGPRALPSAARRRSGFLETAAGTIDVAWEHEVAFSSDLPAEVVTRLQQPDCSLVVCANDAVAVAVLRVLRDAGLDVPSQLSVVGFDDVPWATFVEPPLTTVRQPLAELGAGAVDMLLERLTHPGAPPQERTLPVTLVARRSTAHAAPAGRRSA